MDNNNKSAENLMSYKIIEANNTCAVLFVGNFNSRCRAIVEEIIEKLRGSRCDSFILNFKDVDRIDRTTHRLLIQIQSVIRNDLNAHLRVCELKPGARAELTDHGIIKQFEYFPTFREAITGEQKK